MKIALTIAGSDSSGGAGIQADLKTFQALGFFGMSVVTAVTVQNTQKVYSVHEIEPLAVREQILCLFDDMPIDVVKVGMVSNSKLISSIAKTLKSVTNCPVIVDPVMISKSGYPLLCSKAKDVLIRKLLPMAFVVTPNFYEAEVMTGMSIKNVTDMKNAAQKISDMGVKNIIVKGGHLDDDLAIDVLFDGDQFTLLKTPRIYTTNTHGTGCTLSSAVAAYVAKGFNFVEAASLAKNYVTGAIANSINIGKGCGPINHFFDLYKKAKVIT